jgi:oligopeptidase B
MTPNALADAATAVPTPPTARKQPKIDVVHGERREDDYFWMREKSHPDVAAYLEAENAYADAVMKPTEAFQGALYDEMLGRIQETDVNVPYRQGAYFYYSRTEQGKQYPILCRKLESLDAPEQVTLDVNRLAEGHPFMALGAYAVSDDGNLLAYSTDSSGFRQYDLFIKDLRSGQTGLAVAQKTGSVAWAADNQTLFYTVEDEAKRHYRLYRHRIGSGTPDELVFEEPDEAFNIGVGRTRSRAYLILGAGSLTTAEARVLPAGDPTGEWRMLAPRIQDQEYDVDHHDGFFYFRVNDTGRNFRLVKAPVDAPGRENWTEVIPHRPAVMLEGVDFFRPFYVLLEREQGLQRLRLVDLAPGRRRTCPSRSPRIPCSRPPTPSSTRASSATRTSRWSRRARSSTTTWTRDVRAAQGAARARRLRPRRSTSRSASSRPRPTACRCPISLVYQKACARTARRPCCSAATAPTASRCP